MSDRMRREEKTVEANREVGLDRREGDRERERG
jgi:hypothetical protein